MDLILSLSHYKYWILLPLAIVEGPILSVIAGMLCMAGVLDLLFVFPILVVGDALGDSFYYSLGRWSQSPALKKIGRRLGVNADLLHRARILFYKNPAKTILISKVFLGIGIIGLIMSGYAQVPYGRYLRMCLLIAVAQSAVYLAMGMLFGVAFIKINEYLNWFAAFSIVSVFAVLLFFGIKTLMRSL